MATTQREHISIGNTLVVAGAGPARHYRVVGSYHLDGVSSFGGASVAVLTLPEAQAAAGETGRFDQIDVSASPGVTPAQLRGRIAAVLPHNLVVRTGAQQAAAQADQTASDLGFLRTFLLVFAYVALFVGGFIIFNTFSITVAQRAGNSACCAPLAPRAGRSWGRCCSSRCCSGPGAPGSACSPAWPWRPAWTACSRASGPTCLTAALCWSPAPSSYPSWWAWVPRSWPGSPRPCERRGSLRLPRCGRVSRQSPGGCPAIPCPSACSSSCSGSSSWPGAWPAAAARPS